MGIESIPTLLFGIYAKTVGKAGAEAMMHSGPRLGVSPQSWQIGATTFEAAVNISTGAVEAKFPSGGPQETLPPGVDPLKEVSPLEKGTVEYVADAALTAIAVGATAATGGTAFAIGVANSGRRIPGTPYIILDVGPA